jgi:hypothetical protein
VRGIVLLLLLVVGLAAGRASDNDLDETAAMRGDRGAALSLALQKWRDAYVWMRVAEHFKRDRSRVPTILANKLGENLQGEDLRGADRQADQIIRQIEETRPNMAQLEEAAMRGNTEAQGELAWRFCLGDGVASEPESALAWAAVADAFGYVAVPGETMVQVLSSFCGASEDQKQRAREKSSILIEKIRTAR